VFFGPGLRVYVDESNPSNLKSTTLSLTALY
jgi:hypothetical protein